VVVLTVDYGRLPWVALAFSFGSYGLCKKTANVGATESLAYETAVTAPFVAA
jgi:chloramphenicol-sensitive protein RarD